jgi:hypothetical protein
MITKTFLNHPFIQTIANTPRWSISTADKIPLDMHEFMVNDRIKWGNCYNSQSMTSLTKIVDFMDKWNQTLTNCCFYLNTLADSFIVLDVEPSCRDELKEKFLNTPFIYGEKSMSGKGYHLIYPVPQWLNDYPAAKSKTVIKDKNGEFEILMEHFCTFTGNIIPTPGNPTDFFDKEFQKLAKKQKEYVKLNLQFTDVDKPNTPNADKILNLLQESFDNYPKTPDDFTKQKGANKGERDPSAYEYNVSAYLYNKYKIFIAILEETSLTYDDAAWFIYKTVVDNIEERPKHLTTRNGFPYLMYTIHRMIERVESKEVTK